ncbi:SDR family oxidoreductase [Aridibaculum aurantiacum]|uniref:SDR family oxidoreductase n=1 Tax=Aridibaculum aurantiacum TaxID=2810307 RepID=UPI001A95CBCE|nr:SDR family oxidoreductase [Aridibaculum aurantiacum]
MRVLIIGGSGLVGGNIHQLFQEEQPFWNICSTHRNYATAHTVAFDPCTSMEEWPTYITSIDWNVIIHTGALTHVDRCETEPELSYLQTVVSTQNLVAFANQKNSRFIYISTDYVFDGTCGPYDEAAPVKPLNIYGQHKLLAEKLVAEGCDEQGYLIIRITNVYGNEERGKNYVLRTIGQIKEGVSNFSAPFDQYATPINATDIARAILLLINGMKKGVYHLASTDYLSRVQLLQRISIALNIPIKVSAVATNELNQPAARPLKGGLFAQRFLMEFPDFKFSNLDDFLRK